MGYDFTVMETEMHTIGPGIEVPFRTSLKFPDQENLEAYIRDLKQKGKSENSGFVLGETSFDMDEILEFLSVTEIITEDEDGIILTIDY